MTISFDVFKESFGRPYVKEKVKADRQVIGIVCNVKGYHLLLFPLFIVLYKREDKATIYGFIIIFGFKLLFPPINKCLIFYLTTCGHLKN